MQSFFNHTSSYRDGDENLIFRATLKQIVQREKRIVYQIKNVITIYSMHIYSEKKEKEKQNKDISFQCIE